MPLKRGARPRRRLAKNTARSPTVATTPPEPDGAALTPLVTPGADPTPLMTDEDYEIASEPPSDSDGHPVHPDQDKHHKICAATKSDRTTPTEHGRERDDVEYCLLPAGWGTDREFGPCRNHPIEGPQLGESNPNFKDGRTSEYFKSKLSERQREVYDEVRESMGEDADPSEVLSAFITRLMLLGEHAQDASIIREARGWAKDFGVLETPPEKHEVSGTVEHDHQHDVPEHVVEAITGAAESNLEGNDET